MTEEIIDIYEALEKEINSLKQRINILEQLISKNDELKNRFDVLEKLVMANSNDINDIVEILHKKEVSK